MGMAKEHRAMHGKEIRGLASADDYPAALVGKARPLFEALDRFPFPSLVGTRTFPWSGNERDVPNRDKQCSFSNTAQQTVFEADERTQDRGSNFSKIEAHHGKILPR